MENGKSIRSLAFLFVILSCSLFIVFAALFVNFFFGKGLELSVLHRLRLEASTYAEQYAVNPDAELPKAANFVTAQRFEDLPAHVRANVRQEELEDGAFIVIAPNSDPNGTHSFVYSWKRPDGAMLHFVYGFGSDDASDAVREAVFANIYTVLFIGGAVFVCMILLAIVVIRKLTHQINRLNAWAQQLDTGNVDAQVDDYHYAELNELAALFHKSMQRVVSSVQREQRFLRSASHELRTPIAVLQSNLDWLVRLEAGTDAQLKQPVHAMGKAVKNMRELVTTFLWMSRKEMDTIPRTEVDVTGMTRAIIDANGYLLENKDVRVREELDGVTVIAPSALVHVIVSNIVRNAFQHSVEGSVRIRLGEQSLTVSNETAGEGEATPEDSHGLGLLLIRELTDNLGWSVVIEEGSGEYTVTLDMHAVPATSDS